MIKFNTNHDYLTLEDILYRLDQVEFFKRYIPNFLKEGRSFSSPFREDKNPSCKIYKYNNQYVMCDYALKKVYNVATFIMEYCLCDFQTALVQIDREFNLGIMNGTNINVVQKKIFNTNNKKQKKKIQIKKTLWRKDHIHYWEQHGYNLNVIKKLGIVPISHYWINKGINSKMTFLKQIGFAYTEWSPHYKIYLPHAEKGNKFLGNVRSQHIQCGRFLPDKREVLIITSSMKDCIFFWNAGVPAVAPQSESPNLDKKFVKYIKKRFNQILVIYDNDYKKEKNWGQINALKLIKTNPDFKNVVIPEIAKDPSELALQLGYENAYNKICESVKNQTKTCLHEMPEKDIITNSML